MPESLSDLIDGLSREGYGQFRAASEKFQIVRYLQEKGLCLRSDPDGKERGDAYLRASEEIWQNFHKGESDEWLHSDVNDEMPELTEEELSDLGF